MSHRKGRPARLRSRTVVLSDDGAEFFRQQAKGKLPNAWLFTDPSGKPWNRHEWAAEFRIAAAAVNARAKGKRRIPTGASAYSFRHARISELLQLHGVDPLTVATQTGTSLRMIEQAYYKFIPSAMADKLRAVKEATL
jgi:integrase